MKEAAVQPRKKVVLWAAVSAAILVAGALILVFTGFFASPEPNAEPAPVVTPSIEVTPEPEPEPEPDSEPEPTPGPPVVDIASTQKMPYSPVWNPPDTGEYFWQIVDEGHGYPEDDGTDFLLAHACETQECAGDEVRKLQVDDSLTYLGETYVVERKITTMKNEIGDQDIWTHDPNRIVIITCIIETTWDQSDKNDIIVATKVG